MNYSVILLQVVITYTSYLCKQLLSISSEVRASMVIQRAWRRFHAKMELSKKLVIFTCFDWYALAYLYYISGTSRIYKI